MFLKWHENGHTHINVQKLAGTLKLYSCSFCLFHVDNYFFNLKVFCSVPHRVNSWCGVLFGCGLPCPGVEKVVDLKWVKFHQEGYSTNEATSSNIKYI